jgi:hypothetical protein
MGGALNPTRHVTSCAKDGGLGKKNLSWVNFHPDFAVF